MKSVLLNLLFIDFMTSGHASFKQHFLLYFIAGTGNPEQYPCPIGFYCPAGSGQPFPCPKGYYGNQVKANSITDCVACPVDTFNNMLGQSACRPCGSSATATEGELLINNDNNNNKIIW